MILRARYEGEGPHVRVRLFSGYNEASLGHNGTLTFRLEEFAEFRRILEAAGGEVLPEREVKPKPRKP